MFFAVLGFLFALAGTICLYTRWKNRGKSSVRVWVGWILLAMTPWCWIQTSGAEFGWCYAFIGVAVSAFLLIGWQADLTPQVRIEKQLDKKIVYRPATIPRNILLFVLTIPLAGISATMLTMSFSSLLPLSRVNMMVLSVTVMPVMWGLAVYWVCADSKLFRPAAGLSLLGGLSALFIYV